ncbi:MAG: hypothetical protein AAGA16_08675 [Cyanobacteria bacterium P01_E01_bin.35]
MMASRLDITQIFTGVDNFYLQWSKLWESEKQLPSIKKETRCPKGYPQCDQDESLPHVVQAAMHIVQKCLRVRQ